MARLHKKVGVAMTALIQLFVFAIVLAYLFIKIMVNGLGFIDMMLQGPRGFKWRRGLLGTHVIYRYSDIPEFVFFTRTGGRIFMRVALALYKRRQKRLKADSEPLEAFL